MGDRAKWVKTVPVVISHTPNNGVLLSLLAVLLPLLVPRAEVKNDNPPTAAASDVIPDRWNNTRKVT